MCVPADNTIRTEFITRKKTCQKCRIQQNGFSKFLRPFKNRHRSLLGARWMCLVTSWMNWMKIIKLYCQSAKTEMRSWRYRICMCSSNPHYKKIGKLQCQVWLVSTETIYTKQITRKNNIHSPPLYLF